MGNQTNVMTGRMVSLFFAVLAGFTTVAAGQPGRTPIQRFFYVDAVYGDDNNEGKTPATAFATIQRAIDTAANGGTVLVYPGLYRGEINFMGKTLVVQGLAAETSDIPVLHNPGDFAVSFYSGEGPGSILKNFVIKGSFMAVFIAGSSPTVSNVTVVDNTYGIEAYVGSEPEISNSIFWRNTGGDLFGCQARFSRTSEAGEGQRNITDDPLFVDPNSGDYHLLSTRGRYWPEHDVWVLDRATSPCIDGGDPNAGPSDEPIPNGGRVNMGAYGGTMQASMSPERPLGQASNPNPADGAVEVDRDAELSWDPGSNAVVHDVYFGSEIPLPLVSTQSATQFDPGRMDNRATYFWRIDEFDSEGNRAAGNLWTFRTFGPKGRACFVAETGVWADGSLVSISKVGMGRSVHWVGGFGTKDSSQPLPHSGRIEEVQEHEGVFECYDVLLEGGNCISVAERHYFLAESGKWVAVQNLRTGARLRTATGSIAIMNVARRSMPYVGKVYNLKVQGSDRYLVGKDAVVVRDY